MSAAIELAYQTGRPGERALAAMTKAIKGIPRQQETKDSPKVALDGTLMELVNSFTPTQQRPDLSTFLRRKASRYEVTDFFAGGGGTGLGALWACMGETYSYNHWPEAVAIHALNTGGRHFIADLNMVGDYVGRGILTVGSLAAIEMYTSTPILWNSAPCRYNSGAKTEGHVSKSDKRTAAQKEEAMKKTRGSMYSGVEYAAVHRPKVVITENVEEIYTKWDGLRGWKVTWEDMGYDLVEVHLNSKFVGDTLAEKTPADRDRVYFVHVLKEIAHQFDFTFRPEAECTSCHRTVLGEQTWKNGRTRGKYKTQYIYTCPRCHEQVHPVTRGLDTAMDLINDPATPIAQRTLGATTMTRLRNGAQYLIDNGLPAQPLIVTQDRSNLPDIKRARPWTWSGQTLTGRQVLGVASHPDVMTGSTKPATSLPPMEEWDYRQVSSRELFNIAGFPSNWALAGSKRDQALASGNAVSPRVSQWFFEQTVTGL